MPRKTREKQPLDISLSTPREGEKGRKNKTEFRRLSEEDSNRTRLPAGGRKKVSEELEINMRGWVISKQARHKRVSRKMIRATEKQMFATVSDSRDEELLVGQIVSSANFRRRRQLLPRRIQFTENSPRSWRSWSVKIYWWLMAVQQSAGPTPS